MYNIFLSFYPGCPQFPWQRPKICRFQQVLFGASHRRSPKSDLRTHVHYHACLAHHLPYGHERPAHSRRPGNLPLFRQSRDVRKPHSNLGLLPRQKISCNRVQSLRGVPHLWVVFRRLSVWARLTQLHGGEGDRQWWKYCRAFHRNRFRCHLLPRAAWLRSGGREYVVLLSRLSVAHWSPQVSRTRWKTPLGLVRCDVCQISSVRGQKDRVPQASLVHRHPSW